MVQHTQQYFNKYLLSNLPFGNCWCGFETGEYKSFILLFRAQKLCNSWLFPTLGKACMGIRLFLTQLCSPLSIPWSVVRTIIHLVTQTRDPLTLPPSSIPTSVSCTCLTSLGHIHSSLEMSRHCVWVSTISHPKVLTAASLPHSVLSPKRT